jgi:hypothetical protein
MTTRLFPDNKFLDLLRDCDNTLTWLSATEPVSVEEIPIQHAENVKSLEKVGVIYKRNNRYINLRRQRLKKIAEQIIGIINSNPVLGISKAEYVNQLGLGFLNETYISPRGN